MRARGEVVMAFALAVAWLAPAGAGQTATCPQGFPLNLAFEGVSTDAGLAVAKIPEPGGERWYDEAATMPVVFAFAQSAGSQLAFRVYDSACVPTPCGSGEGDSAACEPLPPGAYQVRVYGVMSAGVLAAA